MMKVILPLDVYRHVSDGERYWERQVWVGEMPQKENWAACDPLLLQKEYESGAENLLFRLDRYDVERNEARYRPAVFHASSWFLAELPQWGFRLEGEGGREPL